MQAANLQKHNKEGGKTEKRAKILIMALCGAVLVNPVQMDAWMGDRSGGAVTWMDPQEEKIMQNSRMPERRNCCCL